MIPIPKMDLDLEDFLTRENSKPKPCVKCAYVVPTYEISKDSDHMPINKTELITYVKVRTINHKPLS